MLETSSPDVFMSNASEYRVTADRLRRDFLNNVPVLNHFPLEGGHDMVTTGRLAKMMPIY